MISKVVFSFSVLSLILTGFVSGGVSNIRYFPQEHSFKAPIINDDNVLMAKEIEVNRMTPTKSFIWDTNSNTIRYEKNDGCQTYLNNCSDILCVNGENSLILNKNGFIEKINIKDLYVHEFNSLKQILVERPIPVENSPNAFVTIPTIWWNGVMADFGPKSEFAKKIEAFGYHVNSIYIITLNDHGNFVGYFGYSKWNRFSNNWVLAGFKMFYFDGSTLRISEKILDHSSNFTYPKLELNNRGMVLIHKYHSDPVQIWNPVLDTFMDLSKEFRNIPSSPGRVFNDDMIVIGYMNQPDDDSNFCLWVNGRIITLDSILGGDLHNLAPPFNDDFMIERICKLSCINNNGQIAGLGLLWGCEIPFVITIPQSLIELQSQELGN